MSDDYLRYKLHRLVDEKLLQRSSFGSVHNFFISVKNSAELDPELDWERDQDAVLEYWWHLAVIEVVAVSAAGIIIGSSVSEFILTDWGRELLSSGQGSPPDPFRYLAYLSERVGQPDSIALIYLEEALEAWTRGLYRSAMVMNGCACERLVLMLAEATAEAGIEPWSTRLSKALGRQGKGSPVPVSQLFSDVRTALVDSGTKERLGGSLRESVDRYLSPIFEHARGLRNAAGHPTAVEVSRSEAQAVLLLFPTFHEVVSRLRVALVGNDSASQAPS